MEAADGNERVALPDRFIPWASDDRRLLLQLSGTLLGSVEERCTGARFALLVLVSAKPAFPAPEGGRRRKAGGHHYPFGFRSAFRLSMLFLMRHLRLPAALATISCLALVGVGPAHAAEPVCEGDVWSRPGLERTVEVRCLNASRVRVAEQPAHGTVTALGYNGWVVAFRLVTSATAPARDQLVLELDGSSGSVEATVPIINVPLEQNTPPRCQPVNTARRTAGTGPEIVEFYPFCWDEEHDDFTLYGSGPGIHLDAPRLIRDGLGSDPLWRYRTAVSSGPEQTSYWAIDSQGAKSAEAPVGLQLGPDVDRPPTCQAGSALPEGSPPRFPVYMRPGVPRRFGVWCLDPDGDPLVPRVGTPPAAGTLTRFLTESPTIGPWGRDVYVDVVYSPDTDSTAEVPLSVVAGGPRGEAAVDIRMRPRALPANGSSSCFFGEGSTTPGTPVTLEGDCSDEDGDPVTATVTVAPQHGTAADPVVRDGRRSDHTIGVPYTPDAGFEGSDVMTVHVTDGNDWSQELRVKVVVASPPPPLPPMPIPGMDPDGWLWSPGAWALHRQQTAPPAEGQAPAVTPERQARRALRARSVRLVRRLGAAHIYAPRRPLRPAARLRALAVTCSVRCAVASAARLSGAPASRTSLTRVSPGRAGIVMLRLTRSQRSELRRARRGRAVFRISARPTTGRNRSTRVVLALRD